jgi:colanic acid biosynthesis glycosyl transferase WcaI
MSYGSDEAHLRGLRVLMIGMYYAPETTGSAPYTTDTAEDFARRGATVDVVTTHPHYPAWRREEGIPNRWSEEVRNEVRVHRVPTYVPAQPTLVRRLAYEASFVAAAVPTLRGLAADVVVGTTPNLFSAVAAAQVARQRKLPLIHLIQDVVTSAVEQTGQTRGRLGAGGMLARLEGSALRAATTVTVPTDAFRAALSALGVDGRSVVTVPNWCRLRPRTVDREKRRRELGWRGDDFVVLHTGNMGMKQGLEELSPSLREMAVTTPGIRFVFIGDGNQRLALAEATDGLPNVDILPSVRDDDYYSTLVAADALLVHERSTVRDMSLPSKLTSYFASGRPVVAVVHLSGATAAELAASRAGVAINHGDDEGFKATLMKWRADRGSANEIGSRGVRYCETRLRREVQLNRLAHLVGGAVRHDAYMLSEAASTSA